MAVTKTLYEWTKAAEAAAAQNRLSFAQISKDADGVGIKFKELTDFALKYGDSIAVDDEDIVTLMSHFVAMANLKPFGGDTQKTAERFAKLTYDIAAGTKQSADSIATIILSLANDAPTRALPRLQKMGQLTLDQVTHFKDLIKAGKTHEASLAILEILQKRWNGEAGKGVSTSEKLKTTWQNFKEEVGQKFLPILETVQRAMLTILNDVLPLVRRVHTAGDAWKLFRAAAQFAFDEIKYYFGGTLEDMVVMFEQFIGSIMSVLGKIPGLGGTGAIGDLLKQFQIRPDFQGPPPVFHKPTFSHRGGGGVRPGQSAPATAMGGIVTSPQTRLVGEAGPEAIIPLNRGMTVQIVDSNLDLVMSGVLQDAAAFAARSGRAHR